MRSRLTASKIALARSCLWWARGDACLPGSVASGASDLGDAFHATAERESDVMSEDELDAIFRDVGPGGSELTDLKLDEPKRKTLSDHVDAWREWFSGFEIEHPWHAQERPLALDTSTGSARLLPSKGHRDYSGALPWEVPGTIDLIGLGSGLTVVDYKTGSKPHRYIDHEDQMRHLATAAGLAFGAWEVRAIVAHVTPDGVSTDGRVLDSLDFAIVTEELRTLVAGIDDAEAKPGLHCDDKWCPGRAVCPATRSLLLAAKLPVDGRRHLSIVGPIASNDDAYATLIGLDLLEEWIKERRRTVKAYSDTNPILSPEGLLYGPAQKSREVPVLDVAGAPEALRAALGALADEAIETKVSTSWDAIGAAFRRRKKLGEKVSIKDGVDMARAALRSVGAVKISKFPEYKWRENRA